MAHTNAPWSRQWQSTLSTKAVPGVWNISELVTSVLSRGEVGVHFNNAALNVHTHCPSVRAHPSLIVEPLWVFTRSYSADTFTRTSIRLLLTNQTTKTLSIISLETTSQHYTDLCRMLLSPSGELCCWCSILPLDYFSVMQWQSARSHYRQLLAVKITTDCFCWHCTSALLMLAIFFVAIKIDETYIP